jgi:hypothetical protein
MTSPALASTYFHLADLAPVLARRAIELALAGDTSLMRTIVEHEPGKSRQQLSAEVRYGLILQSRPQATRVIIIERPVLRIGRQPTNDIVIPDLTVSRRHARLEQGCNGLVLTDENSCNGTTVNGCRITTSTVLRPGDIVRFGTSICQLWRIPLRKDVTPHPDAVSSAAGQDQLCIDARIALISSVQRLEAESHLLNA